MKPSTGILAAVALTAVVVSVPLVLSADGADSPAREGSTPGKRSEAPTAPAAQDKDPVLSLPLARYSLTRDQQVILDRAQIRLQESCVRRLTSSALPPREVPDATAAQETSRRYGLLDLESAKRYGYQSPDSPPDNASRPKPDATQMMLLSGETASGETVKTYKGRAVPEGGCSAEARRVVYRDHDKEPGIAVAQQIDIDGYKLSLQESRVLEAFSAWSQCMKSSGYSYTSPLEVTDDPEFADADSSGRERAVAQADVKCKLKVRLPQTWLAAESAIQKEMIQKNQFALERLSQSQREMVQRAQSILGKE